MNMLKRLTSVLLAVMLVLGSLSALAETADETLPETQVEDTVAEESAPEASVEEEPVVEEPAEEIPAKEESAEEACREQHDAETERVDLRRGFLCPSFIHVLPPWDFDDVPIIKDGGNFYNKAFCEMYGKRKIIL